MTITKVVQDVLAERQRQIYVEGFDAIHDDDHRKGELADAAACYANPGILANNATGLPVFWPFDKKFWKPKSRRQNLVRAAALLIAEIERLDRISDRASERS